MFFTKLLLVKNHHGIVHFLADIVFILIVKRIFFSKSEKKFSELKKKNYANGFLPYQVCRNIVRVLTILLGRIHNFFC
jgi:hypothetical protein